MCSLQGDYVITAKRAEKITIVEERHLLFKKKRWFLLPDLPLLLSISSLVSRDHFLQHVFNTPNVACFILESLNHCQEMKES